jgi:hypothetical protein
VGRAIGILEPSEPPEPPEPPEQGKSEGDW